jgi:hypothetical protein
LFQPDKPTLQPGELVLQEQLALAGTVDPLLDVLGFLRDCALDLLALRRVDLRAG